MKDEETKINKIDLVRLFDSKEINRSMKISSLGMNFDSPFLFLPEYISNNKKFYTSKNNIDHWKEWRTEESCILILNHIKSIFKLFEKGTIKECVDADFNFDTRLRKIKNIDKQAISRSVKGGEMCKNALVGASNLSKLIKFRSSIDKGLSYGHFASFFTLKSIEFNLPLMKIQFFYFYFEWLSGYRYYNKLRSKLGLNLFTDLTLRRFIIDNFDFISDLISIHNINKKKNMLKLCA